MHALLEYRPLPRAGWALNRCPPPPDSAHSLTLTPRCPSLHASHSHSTHSQHHEPVPAQVLGSSCGRAPPLPGGHRGAPVLLGARVPPALPLLGRRPPPRRGARAGLCPAVCGAALGRPGRRGQGRRSGVRLVLATRRGGCGGGAARCWRCGPRRALGPCVGREEPAAIGAASRAQLFVGRLRVAKLTPPRPGNRPRSYPQPHCRLLLVINTPLLGPQRDRLRHQVVPG